MLNSRAAVVVGRSSTGCSCSSGCSSSTAGRMDSGPAAAAVGGDKVRRSGLVDRRCRCRGSWC